MNNPYDTPNAAPQIDSGLKEFPKFRKLAITGIILLTGPFFGLLGTVIGMSRAYATLSVSEGDADPELLAGDISVALLTTLYGALIGLLGVVIVSVVLFSGRNRERWFYRCTIGLAIAWCVFLFPIGLVVGSYLIIIFVNKRQEFEPTFKRGGNKV